jgi:hypothetical protein
MHYGPTTRLAATCARVEHFSTLGPTLTATTSFADIGLRRLSGLLRMFEVDDTIFQPLFGDGADRGYERTDPRGAA